ncbi:integrin-binding sialoprotein [Eleutherodactylus coqui]|uniref:integrin-binding sialoprotein n=1 Tax=Eleutherodactylus coqui TaxID=57060 RepID=UPI003461FDA3
MSNKSNKLNLCSSLLASEHFEKAEASIGAPVTGKMKTALIFIVLWGLSSAFYINRFQRKWKGDDSDEKGAVGNRYSNVLRHMYFQAPPRYITYAKGSDSSEENEDGSDEQEESVDAGKNGNNAASEETGAEESEGNGAEEEADSEGAEEENGGTSAPEVEETTASQNETTSIIQESSTEAQPTQVAIIEETAAVPAELPRSNDYDNLGTEEGSNGGVPSTAPVYEPDNNGYQYENGYYYHENAVEPRGVKGETYGRYEDEYQYRNYLHQLYAQQYYQHYYQ